MLEMAQIKACIFDLDGVIVDTAAHHFVAWSHLADELGVEFSKEDNEQLKGVSRVDSLEYILKKGGLVLDAMTKLQLMDRKNELYLELANQTTKDDLLPGIEPFLLELKNLGIQIGLGSSSKNAPMILELLGITNFFQSVVDGNRITLSKPDPEVFLLGSKELAVPPNQCLVFEDAQSGIDAALAGGFHVIGVGDSNALIGAKGVITGFNRMNWHSILRLVRGE